LPAGPLKFDGTRNPSVKKAPQMKTKRLTGWKEMETLDILDRSLRGYRVVPKIRMIDVIGPDPADKLSSRHSDFLFRAHFDFVVYDRRRGDLAPIFAVEFDGPFHHDEKQVKRDITKNRLCMLAQFPLLRIGYAELEKHDKISLLEYMLQLFIAWQREEKQIKAEIESHLKTLSSEEIDHLIEGCDPSLDPTFLFDLEHPFPGIFKVTRRLFTRFRIIVLPYARAAGFRGEQGLQSSSLVCNVMWAGMHYGSTGQQMVKKTGYALYRHDPAKNTHRWIHGKLEAPGLDILCEGVVEFGMQWILRTEEDYSWEKEAPIEYMMRTGKIPHIDTRVPGIHIPNVAESFSEYLALREIEKWAEKHLIPASRAKN